MPVIETARLVLDELTTDDAEFILELLNEEAFVRHIGDKGVRNEDDACQYILKGPVASYERFGFGLYRVALRDGGQPIGICGVLKRDTLDYPDLGFAFLRRFWAKGYAFESATAAMIHARKSQGVERLLAITSQENTASIVLLGKLGFTFEHLLDIPGDEAEVKLFASQATPPETPSATDEGHEEEKQ